MADKGEGRGAILHRHKRELREFEKMSKTRLRGKQGDEKKALQELLRREEEEMIRRHAVEAGVDEASPVVPVPTNEELTLYGTPQERKPGRQQRRKERREQEAQERRRVAEEETRDLPRLRETELQKIHCEQLDPLGLAIAEVYSDGHCLYRAVVHQLQRFLDAKDVPTVSDLRRRVAAFMRTHAESFEPFMAFEEDDQAEISSFSEYCDHVENTASWGGQLEVQALADLLCRPLRVYSADSPVVEMGSQYDDSPLLLSFHRHYYGLGEHYNSVVPR